MEEIFDLIIVGAGPAGLSASLQALRAKLNTLIIERESIGGTLNYTNSITNYLGFTHITGFELSNKMMSHVSDLGAKVIFGTTQKSSLKGKIKKINIKIGLSDREFQSKSVIISIGSTYKTLKCDGSNLEGVSYCAFCEGFLYQINDVAVVGGGNSAAESALYLSNICNEVFLIIRSDSGSFDKILLEKMKLKSNINILFNREIKKIKGDRKVEGIEFHGEYPDLKVSAVFVNIGRIPMSNDFNDLCVDDKGYFLANQDMETNIDGVFVSGDCVSKKIRQISTAVSDGTIAGMSAIKYLQKIDQKNWC